MRSRRNDVNLTCPACGAPFSADDVHADIGVANCRVCRGVLDLRSRARALEMPRPARFALDESDGRMRIEWRWFQASKLAMIPFAIVWWVFLIFWYKTALAKPSQNWFALVFPLGHVAVGVSVLYSALANLVNRTRLVADDEGICVSHGPLPWPGKRFERARLIQLFCETVQGKNSVTFALCGVDVDGKRVRVLGGFADADEPRWLEAALECRLQISNRPVAGELASG